MRHPIPFGDYLLLERINVGGMAEVFVAKGRSTERTVAIKRTLPSIEEDEELVGMFMDEARIAGRLRHASIVRVYEHGKLGRQHYIVMEYVSGKDLRRILEGLRAEGRALPWPAAAYIAGELCAGLDYAHRYRDPGGRPLDIVHRDVSPQNVLIGFGGAVKLADFGIATAGDCTPSTRASLLEGKLAYASPEQARGLEADRRADIFAAGILLYEMVTGRRLFLGENDAATREKVRRAEVLPPTELNPEIPPELERVMLEALARERDERYQWASELRDALRRLLRDNDAAFDAKRLAGLLRKL